VKLVPYPEAPAAKSAGKPGSSAVPTQADKPR
jgi:hypothetical protein